jgi:cell shape-determining protein MreC
MIVEVQNASKEKTEDKTCSTDSHAIIFRERVANRSQRVSIRHQFVNNIVHDFDHELESRFFEMKNDQNQEKKNERLKSNISLEFSSISRRIESKNNMTSLRDRSS